MIQRCVHIHVNLELIVWVALAMTELYKAISCMRNHAQRDFTVSWVPVLPWGMDYARVDLLRGLDGNLKLIELEMIEPYLYLPFADEDARGNLGAQKLAAAVAKAVSE